MFTSI
jgi:hypothetical protein